MSGGDWKAMFAASQVGDADLVRYYLGQGIDPNYQHPEFLTTALIEAATLGQLEVVKCLIEGGADPCIKAVLEGYTALEAAKLHKQREVVEYLSANK